MSTRAQVKVTQTGIGWEENVTLYHHCDGYPTGILPLILEAYNKYGKDNYEGGRAGKVASFLCAVDPGHFEPEDNHELHSDIQYYYILNLVNKTGGSLAEHPKWVVSIYDRGNEWKELNTLKDMRLIIENVDINNITDEMAEKLDNGSVLCYPNGSR